MHTSFAGCVGDLVSYVQSEGLLRTLEFYEKADLDAWVIFGVFGLIQALFQLFLPGKTVQGPITPKGNTPIYKVQ